MGFNSAFKGLVQGDKMGAVLRTRGEDENFVKERN
jgi:hypothetical protein